MKHSFNIVANHKPATLERVLRVVRHRGFALQTFNVSASDSEQVAIELTVTGERPIATLQTQLDKLYDIAHLELIPANADAQSAGIRA
ncbi:acetolactate synthase 2 small subunit [Saccharobesus litoralis]|uniref:Acetolactate synthase 2 small subunit n=1 Tax=Saccharobesus litoralis TaxID=2172099 RepID=A0A2S0VXA5_9ALTE|nr:acetolactate synthase 2 small subunit [Saccharobesus litoralis]AWB68828.1 acetolactate synthase 2 small subunit [Saccharobesus litoralis]